VSLSSNTLQRRIVTVPMLFVAAMMLTVLIPVWVPLTVIADVARLRWRLPLLRLLGFGLCWAWLETMGVLAAFGLWVTGQRHNLAAHYRLQAWWASKLLASLGATCGIRIETTDGDVFTPGPTVLFVRHASLADSLVSAYVITELAHLRPHYVLKRELLADPCLDVVGHRIPNYFLDRGAADSAPELAAIETLARGLGNADVGVIFPEGTRANTSKRIRALAKIAERDPDRASSLAALQHLLPPRPSGALAMIRGAVTADVVLAWHVGFEGLDSFGGIVRALARPFQPIRFVARRVPRAEVPAEELFAPWLDEQWLLMDADVGAELAARQTKRSSRER
jgi:1-acyl-sn-glycerol-3-phosphate acyltransferase